MHRYIYIHTHIYVHIHICIYICICTHVYIYIHNSCMRACATVQQLPCHGSYYELILSLARTSCRLSFAARSCLPSCYLDQTLGPSPDAVRSRNPSKSTLAHDAVATAVLRKHHPIIRVGAGLIQFVYRSHLRLATEATRHRNAFLLFFAQVSINL